jgi:hypothetical protein
LISDAENADAVVITDAVKSLKPEMMADMVASLEAVYE